MKIVVTGKNGQLGSEINALKDQYPSFEFIFLGRNDLDITDQDAIEKYFENCPFDLLINCAAYTAVDQAEDDFEGANAVNNLAVQYLVAAAEKQKARVIHISTDYVFDGAANLPYKESDPVQPIGVYGKTKLAGELHVLNAKIPAMVIRTSWVYSSFGNNFVKTMKRLGQERDELGVIVDQVGTPTNARDLADACLQICTQLTRWSDTNEVYHFSNDGVCSWYDFACAIMEVNNIDCNVKPIETTDYPTKAKRPQYSVLNKKKIKEQFGLLGLNWKASLA